MRYPPFLEFTKGFGRNGPCLEACLEGFPVGPTGGYQPPVHSATVSMAVKVEDLPRSVAGAPACWARQK